jgi:hypothetical protein
VNTVQWWRLGRSADWAAAFTRLRIRIVQVIWLGWLIGNLPADYPMVAPNYAAARSQLAKQMGLGQQRRRR